MYKTQNIQDASDSELKWGIDQTLMNLIFFPLVQAREYYSNQMYQESLNHYRFSWSVVRTRLIQKIEDVRISEESRKELTQYFETMENFYNIAKQATVPSNAMNHLIRKQENNENYQNLLNILVEIDSLFYPILQACGLWFKEDLKLPPGLAIKGKFLMH